MKRVLGILILLFSSYGFIATAQSNNPAFKVISFYTAKHDPAHISFVHEANNWFSKMGREHNFQYDSTNNWNNLNDSFLSNYHVVIFLDNRPDSLPQREAFRRYMVGHKGAGDQGAWMGFHFSAFALDSSAYPQNWDWYHERFLGSGEYVSNTWRPTSAILKVEGHYHLDPAVNNIPKTFRSSPNEWYRWKNDLRKNRDIQVILSIDSTSFPLGTGPKPHEIWHSGDYPVAWTNTDYRMYYFNLGHNDMDYGKTNKELSSTFGNEIQDRLILNTLLWLGRKHSFAIKSTRTTIQSTRDSVIVKYQIDSLGAETLIAAYAIKNNGITLAKALLKKNGETISSSTKMLEIIPSKPVYFIWEKQNMSLKMEKKDYELLTELSVNGKQHVIRLDFGVTEGFLFSITSQNRSQDLHLHRVLNKYVELTTVINEDIRYVKQGGVSINGYAVELTKKNLKALKGKKIRITGRATKYVNARSPYNVEVYNEEGYQMTLQPREEIWYIRNPKIKILKE